MNRTTVTAAIIADAIATAATGFSVSEAQAAAKEKCFGVSMVGKNDCAAGAGTSCAGTSKVDYQGNSFKLVAQGTCVSMNLPGGRKGSMVALERDIPS